MSAITLVTAGQVRIVGLPIEQFTYPADESVIGGQACRLATATGLLTKSKSTTAAEARTLGIATRTPEAIGLGITIVRKGVLDGYESSRKLITRTSTLSCYTSKRPSVNLNSRNHPMPPKFDCPV